MKDQIRPSRLSEKMRSAVRSHPLVAFIVLAYAITWIAWLLANLIDLGASNAFSILGGAGPALSGLIVSAVRRPESSGVPAGRRLRLFCITGLLIMVLLAVRRLWFAQALVSIVGRPNRLLAYPGIMAFLADLLAAGVLALFFSGVDSPLQGVRDYLRSLDPRRQPVRWYWCLAAAGLYPAIVLLGNLIWSAFGIPLPAPQAAGTWYWLGLDVVLMFLYVMLGGGGLEEPGWRGFALPLLVKRYSPFRCSLILAVIWAFWHWPLFWLGYSAGGPFGVVLFTLGAIPLSMFFTAVYNLSDGSLPLLILLHTSFNITAIYLAPSTLATGLWTLLMLVIAVWMWRQPEAFSLRLPENEREPERIGQQSSLEEEVSI